MTKEIHPNDSIICYIMLILFCFVPNLIYIFHENIYISASLRACLDDIRMERSETFSPQFSQQILFNINLRETEDKHIPL